MGGLPMMFFSSSKIFLFEPHIHSGRQTWDPFLFFGLWGCIEKTEVYFFSKSRRQITLARVHKSITEMKFWKKKDFFLI